LFAGVKRSRLKPLCKNVDILPDVSIIVPAKDEEAVIARCLKTLLSLDYPKEQLEIIVVDGHSQDATLEICSDFSEKYPDVVIVLPQDESKGKPPALNLALLYATGEIVGFFDADSVPERDVLRKAVSYFQDSSVMAVQGQPISLNERENMLTRVASKEDQAWFQLMLQGREELELFVPLTGSGQFVRRRVLEELGGWDENALAEDVELAVRLVEKDYSVKYAPDVHFWQETPSSLPSLITQRSRWYRGYMEAFIKHGSLLKTKFNKKAVDAEVLLIGPFMMILCLFSYFIWTLNIFVFCEATSLQPISLSALALILTTLPLILVGTALTFMEKPVTIRNLLWIPFIYFYWFIQTVIAGWAFLQIILRRPKTWKKTIKRGHTTSSFVLGSEIG